MVQKSELTLFESLKNGSDEAFKEVYQKNKSLFLSFARKYGLGQDDLLDIYQDSFITLYENIQDGKLVKLSSTLSTYLISIGKYKILDRLRKNKQNVNNELVLELANQKDDHLESFELETKELTPEEVLLEKYFNQLGEKCKAILVMFYYKKYSIREIMSAGKYNSENVVKSQKSRCLKTLKQLFTNTPKK
ncbi:RNA polymerase sigma factor [Aquimarina sp. AU474]|uniref:RNA polymerase sigma factor n=1 Tax=Aquimarina sp. AU474 TaxID=2108529 RepID=UPI000D6A008E|nr:sigma-70 family RNA polymerase sigma factor [Aquimarina sp. AU474]